MATMYKLSYDRTEVKADPTLYRSMIGSLLYLIASRPDLSQSVGIYARYQVVPPAECPKEVSFLKAQLAALDESIVVLTKQRKKTL